MCKSDGLSALCTQFEVQCGKLFETLRTENLRFLSIRYTLVSSICRQEDSAVLPCFSSVGLIEVSTLRSVSISL